MKRWTALLMLGFLFLGSCAKPSNDPEARMQRLGRQRRCPVCRGVPIYDSPSTLSREMMDIVRQQVTEGKTDQEIMKYFEERYGEWVLLAPKAEGTNLFVWFLPALFLVGGGAGIVLRLRQRKQKQ